MNFTPATFRTGSGKAGPSTQPGSPRPRNCNLNFTALSAAPPGAYSRLSRKARGTDVWVPTRCIVSSGGTRRLSEYGSKGRRSRDGKRKLGVKGLQGCQGSCSWGGIETETETSRGYRRGNDKSTSSSSTTTNNNSKERVQRMRGYGRR